MSLSRVSGNLAALVAATSGTFTASYPDGKDESNFYNAMGHKLSLRNGDILSFPKDFDLTFGTSSITVTNKTSSAWEAGAAFVLQLEEQGERAYRNSASPSQLIPSTTKFDGVMVSMAPDAADPDGLFLSANPASGATLTMDGALVSSSVGIFDTPRNVVLVSAGDDSGGTKYITVTGKDVYNNTIVEKIVGVNTATAYGVKAFKKVTSIVCTGDLGVITIGSGNIIGLPVFLPSNGHVLGVMQNGEGLIRRAFVEIEYEQTQLLAGTAEDAIAPIAGFIDRMTSIVQTAVTTGGDLTANVGTTAIVGLTITVADAATKGTVQTDQPTVLTGNDATTQCAARARLSAVGASAFATAGELDVVLEINGWGIFQPGLRAASGSTSTSADIRGTFRPPVDPDGDIVFQILMALPDSGFVGIDQYTG